MSQDIRRSRLGELALIALGANLVGPAGPPAQALRAALARLDGVIRVHAVSRFWRSAAFPPGSGPDFVNAAALVDPGTPPSPEAAQDLLARLHEVEAGLGRTRHARWSARIIDLDLIGWGGLVLPDAATQSRWRALPLERQMAETPDGLLLPHPRLADRAFVLVPLAEIASDWRDPTSGHKVSELLARLPAEDRTALSPLPGPG